MQNNDNNNKKNTKKRSWKSRVMIFVVNLLLSPEVPDCIPIISVLFKVIFSVVIDDD